MKFTGIPKGIIDKDLRLTKLKEIAKQRGISVEQLIAERKAKREQEKAL